MTKGQEALNNIAIYSATHNHLLDESIKEISKELKAFEIMCNYCVSPDEIIFRVDYDAYMFDRTYQEGWTLSKEQWEFCKEVLNADKI